MSSGKYKLKSTLSLANMRYGVLPAHEVSYSCAGIDSLFSRAGNRSLSGGITEIPEEDW